MNATRNIRVCLIAPCLALTALLMFAVDVCAQAPLNALSVLPDTEATDWTRSLVNIEVTYKVHDAFQPWNTPTRAIRKQGVVVAHGEVLTTAQYLPTHTLVRIQKGGRGRWFDARVKWWDAQSNLALLTSEAPDFWKGLQPVELSTEISRGPDFDLVRWRDGNLENRRVEFGQFTVREGVLGFAPHVMLEISTDLTGLGWSEVVAHRGRVLGLTTYSTGRTCGVVPSAFIQRVFDAQRLGKFTGLGYLDFTWQPGSNPELLTELGLAGSPRGAVVHQAGRVKDPTLAPQPRDILLEIDGSSIDIEGDYLDPDFGHLMLENLANRTHFAGDVLPIKLLRGGKEMMVNYRIPRASFTDELVPRETFDRPPAYVVTGGLVFQPLSQSFLRGWGDDWRKYAPLRLQYYQYADAADGRKSLVVLTGVLPDVFNLGYQDERFIVLDKVNGRTVSTLADLVEALRSPEPGADVHRFEFMRGQGLERILLDATGLDEATARVVKFYGMPAPTRL